MRDKRGKFNPENVAGFNGYSSTAMLIEYLRYYVDEKVVAKAERERKKKWYEDKKGEILFWAKLFKGYGEAIERTKRQIETLKSKIRELEEQEFEPRLSVNREKIRAQIRRGQNYLRILQQRLQKYQKRREELGRWLGALKDTPWWKKGFAREYPNMDRIIQDAILDDAEGY